MPGLCSRYREWAHACCPSESITNDEEGASVKTLEPDVHGTKPRGKKVVGTL